MLILIQHVQPISKKFYLSNVEDNVSNSNNIFSVPYVPGVYPSSKTIFMSVRPIQVQTQVHFKILQFLVIAFDMGC